MENAQNASQTIEHFAAIKFNKHQNLQATKPTTLMTSTIKWTAKVNTLSTSWNVRYANYNMLEKVNAPSISELTITGKISPNMTLSQYANISIIHHTTSTHTQNLQSLNNWER